MASLGSHLRFCRALVATNLKASFALRGSFLLQSLFMILNNLVWFSVWWLFFARFGEVGGWRIGDLALLYGIVSTAFGVTVVFAGGVRELARTIHEGELDPLLTQPKSLLLHVLGSRTWPAGWGDMASGLLLVGLSGYLEPRSLPLALVAILSSATVFTSIAVILHSLAFWAGRIDSFSRQAFEFVITFSIYPETLFSGALQLLLYTVIPAGFIGFLPARLLRDYSAATLVAVLCGAAAYALLARFVFARGLRRYESGSRFGVRV